MNAHFTSPNPNVVKGAMSPQRSLSRALTLSHMLPYSSLNELQHANRNLLRYFAVFGFNGAPDEDSRNMLREFLLRAQVTGANLYSDNDRFEGQRIIDFWYIAWQRLWGANDLNIAPLLVDFDAEILRERQALLGKQASPYVGLRAFKEADAPLYFGRDEIIDQIIRHLEYESCVLTGAHGAGKTSLLEAGIIPRTRNGNTSWKSFLLQPGATPLLYLISVVTQLPIASQENRQPVTPEWCHEWTQRVRVQPVIESVLELVAAAGWQPSDRVLLVVDQWEDLYLVCEDVEERHLFIQCLIQLTEWGKLFRVLIGARNGFGAIISTEWGENAPEQFNIGFPSEDELKDIVLEPARIFGLKFEDNIVHDLVKNVIGESSGLLLLQFFLQELWRNAYHEPEKDPVITRKAYTNLGGSSRLALMQIVSEFCQELDNTKLSADPTVQDKHSNAPWIFSQANFELAKHILWRLVDYRDGMGYISNSVTLENLLRHIQTISTIENITSIRRIYDEMVANGILRASHGLTDSDVRVEISHTVLLKECKVILSWLQEKRDILSRRGRLEEQANEWLRFNKKGNLLVGMEALEEERWLHRPDVRNVGYSNVLKDYMKSSRDALVSSDESIAKFAKSTNKADYIVKAIIHRCHILDMEGTTRHIMEAHGVKVPDGKNAVGEIQARVWCNTPQNSVPNDPPQLRRPTILEMKEQGQEVKLKVVEEPRNKADGIAYNLSLKIKGGLTTSSPPLTFSYDYEHRNGFCMIYEEALTNPNLEGKEGVTFRTTAPTDRLEIHIRFPLGYNIDPEPGVYVGPVGGNIKDMTKFVTGSDEIKTNIKRDYETNTFVLYIDNPIVNFYYALRWKPLSREELGLVN